MKMNFKILTVLSLFSGIGAFEKALDNLGIPYNLSAYCEIDKYASKAYSLIHNVTEDKNLHDVTKVDVLAVDEQVDLITYGFPCQDISNAGKQKGFTDETGERTRSGLFFEALRIIEDYRPKFAIAENVKALTSKKFSKEFKTVLDSLDEAGYNNYWQVLNAKDYGIPQNRERLFIISIRKDIDKGFMFPQPIALGLRLKDLLEDNVDESFYLSNETLQNLVKNLDPKEISGVDKSVNNPRLIDKANCITAREDRGISNHKAEGTAIVEVVKNIVGKTRKCEIGVTVHENGDIRPHRMDDKKSGISELQINKDINISNTVTTAHMPKVYGESTNLRIRKLTPTECYKLMGFSAEDCKKVSAGGISNAQLYKQAGNSIVVNVLEAIFTSLGEDYEEFKVFIAKDGDEDE